MKKMSTKDIISKTMLEFLEEKRVTQISVQDIAAEVGVSTRTFYNCFQDKFDVCNYIYDGIVKECLEPDGRRATIAEFFDSLMKDITSNYLQFFRNTLCYGGQNNLSEYIVRRGVRDLNDQLRFTGHADMISPENDMLLMVYMRGLASALKMYFSSSKSTQEQLVFFDKSEMLPRSLYEALTAPVTRT